MRNHVKKFVIPRSLAAMALGHSAKHRPSDANTQSFQETGELTIGHRDSRSLSYVRSNPSRGPIWFYTRPMSRVTRYDYRHRYRRQKSTITYVRYSSKPNILGCNGTIDLKCGSTSTLWIVKSSSLQCQHLQAG